MISEKRIAIEGKFKTAYDTISQAVSEAYKEPFLISNQVLSKIPFNNHFLDNLLSGTMPRNKHFYETACKLTSYYIKSFARFAMYLFRFLEFSIASFRFKIASPEKGIVILETSFILEKIVKSGKFTDEYFPGLKEVLEEKGLNYAYLPFFYSASFNKNPTELYRALRVLKKSDVPVITEYQLLSLMDLVKILNFIIAYPFCLFSFLWRFKADSYENKLLACELIDTLDHVTFYSFTRYLVGRRIAMLPYKAIKVISWYENQAVHKNLYRGLRSVPGKIKIYGAQLFTYPKNYLYISADKREEPFGVVPDKIITNGPYYVPDVSGLNYGIGPSLRSDRIFKVRIEKSRQNNILILLPYLPFEAENILRIISEAGAISPDMIVKVHPASLAERYRPLTPPHISMSETDTYKLFETAKIVVSAASSVLVEAVSIGIPTIVIKNPVSCTYNNPLAEHGKGVIWDDAVTSGEFMEKLRKLEKVLADRPLEIKALSEYYRNMFFHEASEENIVKAFEL